MDIVSFQAGADFLDVFRNGLYAQLDQSTAGLRRVAGIFPEASVYAAYGFMLLVFNVELWLRGILPRWSGTGAVAMATILLISTSSSAYIGLASYAIVLLTRLGLVPRVSRRIAWVYAGALFSRCARRSCSFCMRRCATARAPYSTT
ncbi:MAG: hypothetical protein WDN76_05520 [Alphaproteobacteria bacterium]